MLGLHMVNPEGGEFFIFAEPLINAYLKMKEEIKLKRFVRVKKRDANPKKNRGYHQGEIRAKAVETFTPKSKTKGSIRLYLYFGPLEQKLKPNPEGTGFVGYVYEEIYSFPKEEFTCFVKAIEAMYTQETAFTLMKMGTDVFVERDTKLM